MRYERFHLVLMTTHACNLQCSYCFTGQKFHRSMSLEIGQAAIQRACRSLLPDGILELDFFGGEPLLQAEAITQWISQAEQCTRLSNTELRLGMTTNGTITTDAAWKLLLRPDLILCISHDGLPEVHDKHRRRGGQSTSNVVTATIAKLLEANREFRVMMVVRPDTAALLPDGIAWLWDQGVRRFDLSLDLWTRWDRTGLYSLEAGVARSADFWRNHLPQIGVNWFDEKASHLLGVPLEASSRCGFGQGEIAVAPSGNLYPCERLIGEDLRGHPMRLPGHALDGIDFLDFAKEGKIPSGQTVAECEGCAAREQCSTSCRCSNFVRTGDVRRPDALLCFLDRVCVRHTARALRSLAEAGNQREQSANLIAIEL